MQYFISIGFCAFFVIASVFGDVQEEVHTQCSELGQRAAAFEDAINTTYRYLGEPDEYRGVVEACRAVIHCSQKLSPPFQEVLLANYKVCGFYMFYNDQFSYCANKLISRKDDDVPCLDALFNDFGKAGVDECDQWDSLQPCMLVQIEKVCSENPDQWTKHAAIFRRAMCEKTNWKMFK